jgi:hypothetical protein
MMLMTHSALGERRSSPGHEALITFPEELSIFNRTKRADTMKHDYAKRDTRINDVPGTHTRHYSLGVAHCARAPVTLTPADRRCARVGWCMM